MNNIKIYNNSCYSYRDMIELFCNPNTPEERVFREQIKNIIVIYASFNPNSSRAIVIYEENEELYLVDSINWDYVWGPFKWVPEKVTKETIGYLLNWAYLDENAKYNLNNIDKIKKQLVFG